MKGGKSMAHVIIRGANGRRHEVVFDGAAITVEIFSGEDVVEIVAEANDPLLPSDKRRFSIGDKVMQVENDYDKEVYNGDLGVVRSIDAEASGMVIAFDGRAVTLSLIHI